MAGPVPRRAGQFDRLILQQLRGEFRVLVCDEAQWLSAECFELWRFLWDDKDTKIVLVFVGGHNCYKVLRSKPMLASRVTIWQELQRLSREQVATVIPAFHRIWAQVDPADLAFVDTHAAHGNFRMWVTITRLTVEALTLFDQPRVDRKVLEWVFSKLGGSP